MQPSSNSTASTASIPASTATTVLQRTAEETIAAYLRSSGHEYAGDCRDTNLTEDAGKYCSVMHEDRGATRIYETGPTFSEFDTWLLLQQPRMVGPSSTQPLLARPTHPSLHPGDLPVFRNAGSVRGAGRGRVPKWQQVTARKRQVREGMGSRKASWGRSGNQLACVRAGTRLVRTGPSHVVAVGSTGLLLASVQLPDVEGASSRSCPRPAVHPAVRRWCSTCGRSAEQPHRATRRPPPTAGGHQRRVECRRTSRVEARTSDMALTTRPSRSAQAASTGVRGRH